MPFPFRNPVNPDYDDSGDNGSSTPQQVDPKLEAIVQKMIDSGEPEENIATVIKGYKPATATATPKPVPTTKPTAGTGLGSGPTPNPDDEWWKGFGESLFGGEAGKAGLKGELGWGKGAIIDLPQSMAGGLETIGGLIAHPTQEMGDIAVDIKALPGKVESSFEHAGSDPFAFGETMGQLGGQPLMADIAPGLIKAGAPVAARAAAATLPVAGRGLQNVGEFVARNQPITGLAPPFAVPRTARLLEKGVGKGIDYAGQGLETVGNKLTEALGNVKPESDVVSSTLKQVKKPDTDEGGDKTPPEKIATLQKTATNIQDNIDKKYGGDTTRASASTQKRLADTKAATPLLNRPGTYITVRKPTPQQILQAQQLGYQIESKDSLGNVRMKQTGKPITINQAPRNTDLSNIDLNEPIMGGGGQ